jgi:hypothetical protein
MNTMMEGHTRIDGSPQTWPCRPERGAVVARGHCRARYARNSLAVSCCVGRRRQPSTSRQATDHCLQPGDPGVHGIEKGQAYNDQAILLAVPDVKA